MNNHYKFENIPLPYDYNALEPYIDEKTMQLHHDRHLATYINNLNLVLADHPRLQRLSLTQLITKAPRLPADIRTAVQNNAGGVYNHRFYFDGMLNSYIKEPIGELAGRINKSFGSLTGFEKAFKDAAMSVFGSGYAWLVLDRAKRLRIITTKNQDTPLTEGLQPILNIDVWEHAYYLKHYNLRGDYVDDWFYVVNWQKAEENLKKTVDF